MHLVTPDGVTKILVTCTKCGFSNFLVTKITNFSWLGLAVKWPRQAAAVNSSEVIARVADVQGPEDHVHVLRINLEMLIRSKWNVVFQL